MNDIIERYNQSGVYGLITALELKNAIEDNPRVKAYNLLKAGLQIAKKNRSKSLSCLPTIAFDLSRHDSIYRMSALLYLELGNTQKALQYLAYLHHYYNDQEAEPHEQYLLIRQLLIEQGATTDQIDSAIIEAKQLYERQSILNNIKEYAETLPVTDASDQKTYFKRIYRRYGIQTVIEAVKSDGRFNDRQKAVLLIRASRTIGAIAEEGPSVESKFADIALDLDTSDTVIKNAFQAYLRAGDINKITQLKQQYSILLES